MDFVELAKVAAPALGVLVAVLGLMREREARRNGKRRNRPRRRRRSAAKPSPEKPES